MACKHLEVGQACQRRQTLLERCAGRLRIEGLRQCQTLPLKQIPHHGIGRLERVAFGLVQNLQLHGLLQNRFGPRDSQLRVSL